MLPDKYLDVQVHNEYLSKKKYIRFFFFNKDTLVFSNLYKWQNYGLEKLNISFIVLLYYKKYMYNSCFDNY